MDTIFVLNSKRQVIDVLSNNGSNPSAPFFDDTYKSELDTGAESYEFTTINNTRTNATLEVGNYVLFKYNGKYKLFQIMETTDEHSEGKKLLTVYAEMAGMELRNDYCEPLSVEGNFITFLNTVLQDTSWSVGLYSESLLNNIQLVTTTEPQSVYSLIQNNLSTFGGVEIEFRVEFVGNQLAALLIDCYEAGTRGNRTYRRFEYGEDVKGITRNRNINDLATAVIGVGKNNVDFKDIEWDKSLGNPCDKPLQQNFVVDVEANDLWNNGGKYIKTVYKSDTEDPATLLQEAWDHLQEIKQPKFDYDVDLALIAEDYLDINVGDTNYVVDFDYNPPILLEARVGTLEISFANARDNKCTLTNYKELVSILTQPVDFNTVGNMIQSHFPIGGKDIAMGAIGEGHIDVTYYQAIKTDFLTASLAEVETLIADKADIADLTAINADIENLRANKADITDLNAANGNITNLTSQVGQIETIINGHFTGTDAQVLNITAQNTTIDNAVIKNAMIDTVSADKVNAGTINTNNVVIESEDGGIKISGATQQFKDNTGTVRVQIGKDAQGNFTFCLFSQDGQGILLDETGIKAGAVPNGLIVNDMVSDTANISGSKLDISSVITQINNNETTINSSHIKFDDTGQSLLIAFNTLKNKVETIENITIDGDLSSVMEQVQTNTTNIGVIQGQVSSLISNTTITKENGQVVQLKDDYSTTKQTVSEISTKIGSLETNYKKTLKTSSVQYYSSTSLTELVGGSWQDTAPSWTQGKYMWQRMKYTYTDGSTTYGTASCVAGAKGDTGKQGPQGIQGEQGIQGVKGDTGAKGPQGEKGDKGDTGLQGPQGSKGDTGEQGPKGDKGATGEKGQSLTSSTPQWYLSTSNTSQAGGSWVETMPTITSGKYIWTRFKNVWANPTATTYTTPVLEQIAEATKEVISKQAEFQESLDGFKTTVSETYATREELTNTETSVNSNIDSAVDKAKTDTLAEVKDKYTSKTDYQEFKKSTASSFEQTSRDITMKFDDVTEKTTSIGGELKEFKATVSTNIKFSEDGIDIGKNNSPFSVNINNEQMSFRDGGQDVAYISNQEMLITDANINNSLRLGSFVFFPRSNGNTSLVWDDKGNLIQPAHAYCNKSNNDYPTHMAGFGSDRPSDGDIVTIEMSGVLASTALYWGIFNAGGYVHLCSLWAWETRRGVMKKSFIWNTNTADGEHPSPNDGIHIFPMPHVDGRGVSTITSVKLYRGDNYWGNSDNLIKYNNLGYNGDKYSYVATQNNHVFGTDIYGHLTTGKTYKFTCDTDCANWSKDSNVDGVYAMLRRTNNFGETQETVELASVTNTFTIPTAGMWRLSFCLSKNGTTHWFTNAKIVEVITNGN